MHDLARVPWALLHDAAEAYIGDVSSPLKAAMRCLYGALMSDFDVIENSWQHAISVRFGVPIVAVKDEDNAAMFEEVAANGPHSCAAHAWPFVSRDIGDVDVWSTELAEFNFLLRAKALGFK